MPRSPIDFRRLSWAALAVGALFCAASAAGQGTAFTYQGQLFDALEVANGPYDFEFRAFDSESGGAQVGGTSVHAAVDVVNGQFSVVVDFGTGVFTGAPVWIEISARATGGGAFALLSPRQRVTPAPLAIGADKIDGFDAAELQGAQGPQGPPGPEGPQGDPGSAGAQGPAGPAGPAGPTGDAGALGPAGETGPPGPQGIPGLPGPQGNVGPPGAAGSDGRTLHHGSSAPADATGADGDFYLDTAANALWGPRASGTWAGSGPVSLVGPQGPQGLLGPQGPQGLQGLQGPAGTQGPPGDTGPAGPAGPAGSPGPQGNAGPQGLQGIQGIQGTQGEVGPAGPEGPQGPQGPAGAGRRRYYLTTTRHDGAQAPTACATGYHMASVWEIREPGVLDYESTLGATTADSGEGPPTVAFVGTSAPNDFYGWIRNGYLAVGNTVGANCAAYTSNSPSHAGPAIGLYFEIGYSNSSAIAPWIWSNFNCSQTLRVWCAED